MSFSAALTQWCFLLLLFVPTITSLATTRRPASTKKIPRDGSISRRDALLLGPAATVTAASTLALPPPSHAAAGEVTSVTELLARIKSVPTFCIVNKDGAAYMIVKSDERMAKGYSFTTFQGAKVVLEDAQKTATEKGYGELWEDATITIVPADAAIRLSLTKKERTSQKDQSLNTILVPIPSAVSTDCVAMSWCILKFMGTLNQCINVLLIDWLFLYSRKTEKMACSWTRKSFKIKERFRSFTLIS